MHTLIYNDKAGYEMCLNLCTNWHAPTKTNRWKKISLGAEFCARCKQWSSELSFITTKSQICQHSDIYYETGNAYFVQLFWNNLMIITKEFFWIGQIEYRLFDIKIIYLSIYLIIIIIIIIYSSRVFHISVSWWFFTGVWVTASLLKSPGLVSVFWSSSTMPSFG